MTDRNRNFGAVSVQLLDVGFRFTTRGSLGTMSGKTWLVTSRDGLEEMELRARALRKPGSSDLKAAVAWAIGLVRSGQAPGVF